MNLPAEPLPGAGGDAARARPPTPAPTQGWIGRSATLPTSRAALSVGVDLVELDRIRQAVSRYGERFLKRIFTPDELSRCRDHLPELAVRFAAKEAVSKALGVGLRHVSAYGIRWQEVEVLSDPHGKPEVRLSGHAQALADEQGLQEWAISLSHGRDYAVAFVVASG